GAAGGILPQLRGAWDLWARHRGRALGDAGGGHRHGGARHRARADDGGGAGGAGAGAAGGDRHLGRAVPDAAAARRDHRALFRPALCGGYALALLGDGRGAGGGALGLRRGDLPERDPGLAARPMGCGLCDGLPLRRSLLPRHPAAGGAAGDPVADQPGDCHHQGDGARHRRLALRGAGAGAERNGDRGQPLAADARGGALPGAVPAAGRRQPLAGGTAGGAAV
ncbi:MAG: hypothetical protein AVDCRST_MAG27-2354, partial [uncultured Craurococcus sp.]